VFLWRWFKALVLGLWRFVKGFNRVVVTLVPLVITIYIVAIVVLAIQEVQPEPIPERTALLIAPSGQIVENRSQREPVDALLQASEGEVLLFSLTRALRAAANDERITSIILDLQELPALSTAHAMELTSSLELFKATGKPVIAVGDYFSQGHYLLASQADIVVMNPEGGLELTGFAFYRNYLKTFLDNIYVKMNVFRVGENKSAVEPYLRNDMSPQQREVVGAWLGDLWRIYAEQVEQGRGLSSGQLETFINTFPEQLEQAGGDAAQLMMDAGLIDELLHESGREALLAEVINGNVESEDYQAITVEHYLSALEEPADSTEEQGTIAVVVVEGEMIPGESSQGFAGAQTVVGQIDAALADESVAAIVLRINSPGGSVFAAEVMRQRLLEVKERDLPLVVSMGPLAASGGYYIAADADQIWAQRATLTGSIGVFAAFPTLERLYGWAEVGVDGVKTTELATVARLDTGIEPAGERIIQSLIGNIYQDFIGLVASGRNMDVDAVDAIAGGRVWSGEDAMEIGLVDALGGLYDAVDSAAQLASLDNPKTRLFGTPISPEQLILEQLGREFGAVHIPGFSTLQRYAQQFAPALTFIDSLQDPRNTYVRCLDCLIDF
jgi:protease-4